MWAKFLMVAMLTSASVPSMAQDTEDDNFDPLASLSDLGNAMLDEGPEGGGSIRARKKADMTASRRLKDKRNLEAKVIGIQRGRFPAVALKLKVIRPAKKGQGKAIKKNTTLVVYPKLKVAKRAVNMEHEPTRINAGAFYLKVGDKIKVRLGAKAGKLWEATYIERK